MKQKLTLDFTQGVEQLEVAIMPSHLAKKLLMHYAEGLKLVPTEVIVGDFIDSVRKASKEGLSVAVNVAKEWVEERELINNVALGNWDAYTTTPTKTDVIVNELKDSFAGDEPEGVKIIGKINLHDKPNNTSSFGI